MILNYIDKASGEPVVLLHGMASSLRYWNGYIDELAKTRRVISVDLMGYGHYPNTNST